MAATATYKCKCCGKPFKARTADRARGWALFCSKSCKAIQQKNGKHGPKSAKRKYQRHDGVSPMKFKFCAECGEPAVNGIHTASGIEWLCADHMIEATTHPFSSDAHGQWA